MPAIGKLPKPVLAGEQNPYGGNPHYALYPAPDGCSGHRLCCLILGMYRADYLRAFDRVNLCDGKWSMKEARVMALTLTERTVVLLGRKVCDAFGQPFRPFEISVDLGMCVLPHPSGLNRMWNDGSAILRSRKVVAELCPSVAKFIGAADLCRR